MPFTNFYDRSEALYGAFTMAQVELIDAALRHYRDAVPYETASGTPNARRYQVSDLINLIDYMKEDHARAEFNDPDDIPS